MHRPDRIRTSLIRFLLAAFTATATALLVPTAGTAHDLIAGTAQNLIPDTEEIPDTTVNDFLDLERSLAECISSNPRPGCGREPTSSGDRGGWQQLVLFGVMMSGIAVIFWRVSRAVRRRDASVGVDSKIDSPVDSSVDSTVDSSVDSTVD